MHPSLSEEVTSISGFAPQPNLPVRGGVQVDIRGKAPDVSEVNHRYSGSGVVSCFPDIGGAVIDREMGHFVAGARMTLLIGTSAKRLSIEAPQL
jgi:hypothetical protein